MKVVSGSASIDSQGLLPASALFLFYYLNLAEVLMQSTSHPCDSKQPPLAQLAELGEFCPQHFCLRTHCPGDIGPDNTGGANHDTWSVGIGSVQEVFKIVLITVYFPYHRCY